MTAVSAVLSARPKSPTVPLPPAVLPAAAVAGIAGAVLIPLSRPGIGWLLAGVVATAAVIVADRKSRTTIPLTRRWARIAWAATALALLSVGTFRAAGWLFVLCGLAACVATSLAVVGPRSVNGLLYDVLAVPIEALSSFPWITQDVRKLQSRTMNTSVRVTLSVAATVLLLAIFVPLLGSADATFASVLRTLTPQLDVSTVLRWAVAFGFLAFGTVGALYALASPPARADAVPEPRRRLRGIEWLLPVGTLTLLFIGFVCAQLVALFGGDSYVQRTAHLTYAQYARGGFWQLSTVTVLTLAVVAATLHYAAKDSASGRYALRGLLTVLSLLTLLIVASALGRMWTYQQAFGFTVMRLLVGACELWLGVVYLLTIVAIVRLDQTWLPRAAIGTAMAALLVLAALNPERFVADHNIDRWHHGKSLDTGYLSKLSADVVPAVEQLPDPFRAPILGPVRGRLGHDNWQAWNLSRADAQYPPAESARIHR